MLKEINIQNIQSHENTTLKFDAGVNAIVGSSNNGKSAILRALYWVCYNRPLGTDTLLSHWAFDKKGNQKLPMQVSVKNNNGTVTRRRTKTENQYIVNGEELNVVKTDVPQQVQDILKIGDTNIQKQQDAPFLLSLTSGQVAQYFNRTVNLDIIDRVLSNAESKRRKLTNDVKQCEQLISDFESRKEKYKWVENVEKLLNRYFKINGESEKRKIEIETLHQQLFEFNECEEKIKKYSSPISMKSKLLKMQVLQDRINDINTEINSLEEIIEQFETCGKSVFAGFEKQKQIIEEFEKINSKDVCDEKLKLKEQLDIFNECAGVIEDNVNEIIKLKKQLPEVCPLCGAVLKDGVCGDWNVTDK